MDLKKLVLRWNWYKWKVVVVNHVWFLTIGFFITILKSTILQNSIRIWKFTRYVLNKSINLLKSTLHLFFINSEKFKQSPPKSLICYTISKQSVRENKGQRLNNPLQVQAKTLFLHRKPKKNAQFWTCQFKSVHYILCVSQ